MHSWFWRKQFEAVIVGNESGHVRPLSFVRFRTEQQARRWVEERNARAGDDRSTRFDYRPLS